MNQLDNLPVFNINDRVKVINTGSDIDGITGKIAGLSVNSIVKIYIIILDEPLPTIGWMAITMPNSNLEKMEIH